MIILNKVLKHYGITHTKLASKLDRTYRALYNQQKNPRFSTIQNWAKEIGCNINELIDCGPGYAHFYDPDTGEWLGIRKK